MEKYEYELYFFQVTANGSVQQEEAKLKLNEFSNEGWIIDRMVPGNIDGDFVMLVVLRRLRVAAPQ